MFVCLILLMYALLESAHLYRYWRMTAAYRHTCPFVPLAMHWIMRMLARASDCVMPWLMRRVADGLYTAPASAGPATAPPVVFVGPLGSPNALFLFVPTLLRYLRARYAGSQVYVYLPPVCRLGDGYTAARSPRPSFGGVQAFLEKHLPCTLARAHLVGHSYGSCIVRIARMQHPPVEGVRTELWDPVFAVMGRRVLDRLLAGTYPLYDGGPVPSFVNRLLYRIMFCDPVVWTVLCDARDDMRHELWTLGRFSLSGDTTAPPRVVVADKDHLLPPLPTPVPNNWVVLPHANHGDVLHRLDAIPTHRPTV